MQKTTIHEIAQEAGVSVATVSRVLRNLPGVSSKLTERVHQTLASRESFRPRIKQTRKLTRIALVAYKSEPTMDYFTAMALSGMSKFAFDYAIDVSLLIRAPELLDVPGLVSMLREHGADAAIISYSPSSHSFLEDLKAYQSQISIPLVMCYSECDFLPSVVSDVQVGERALLEHLFDLGHRDIGYLGASYDESPSIGGTQRIESFRQFCASAGLTIKEEAVLILKGKHLDLDIYYKGAQELLRKNPTLTALYCYNDDIAIAAIKATQDLGLVVPKDISITGFDGVVFSAYTNPTLTTYKISAEQMAYEASRLCYVMSKGVAQPIKRSVSQGSLIIGNSTSKPRKA